MPSAIVECVPNFSEGRNKGIIDALALAISANAGVRLLDIDQGPDANRTVYSFIGSPDAVARAALDAARAAYVLIDMSKHSGVHPRIGALDVCPFVPVSGTDLGSCVELSRRVGEGLASELGVPVYLYEAAASRPERRSLAAIRSGEYEGLSAKLARPEWAPDFGPAAFVPRWGATAVGARGFLIAYNINLDTEDERLAKEIAFKIRESGRASERPGRLKEVRAIGWYIDSYRCAQVSINLLDFKTTPLHIVFETVKEEAKKLGLLVTGGEIVGLVPRDAILEAGRHFSRKTEASEVDLVETAIRSLGLDSVRPFDPAKKIVEYAGMGILSSSRR